MAGRRRLMFAKDFTVDYFKFTALEGGGTFTLTIANKVTTANLSYIEYSINDGETWTRTDNVDSTEVVITTPTIGAGKSVLWRGSGLRMGNATTSVYSTFSSTKRCSVSGKINTLLGLDTPDSTTLNTYMYQYLFHTMTKLMDASGLILPSETKSSMFYFTFFGCTALISPPRLPSNSAVYQDCYNSMFEGCSSMTTAPELPATSLGTRCYQGMFADCTSLTTPPNLPATTLAGYCYQYMFSGCTSLTSVPELAAKTMVVYCYSGMFYGCTSLTTAPELPALSLQTRCYERMFYGSTGLNYIKALFTTTPTKSYTQSWTYNIASSGIFVKNINATWTDTGTYAVPANWTVIYYDPNTEKYYLDDKTTECDDHGNPV